jgi:hypothetical protein
MQSRPCADRHAAWWPALSQGLFCVAALALLATIGLTLLSPRFLRLPAAWNAGMAPTLAAAIAAYLFSHVLRALRLAVLAGQYHISLRRLSLVHFFTAAVSLILPLKLGEAYRIVELNSVVRNFPRSFGTVWIERCFDIAALSLIISLIGIRAPLLLDNFGRLIGVALLFVLVTIFGFVIFPENLKALSLFVIRRYRSERSIDLLRVLDAALRFIVESRRIVEGKYLVTGILTALIWSAELLTLSIALPALSGHFGEMLGELMSFLSSISAGSTYFSSPVIRLEERFPFAPLDQLALYALIVRVPLLFCGFAAALLYAPRRLGMNRP